MSDDGEQKRYLVCYDLRMSMQISVPADSPEEAKQIVRDLEYDRLVEARALNIDLEVEEVEEV